MSEELKSEIAVLTTRQERLIADLEKHMEDEEKDREILMARLDSIEAQLSTWKTVVRVLKTLGAFLLLLLTTRLGEIKDFLHHIFR